MKFTFSLISFLCLTTSSVTAFSWLPWARHSDLLVELPYASYQGFFNSTSNLNVWLGVRFAAPPTGNNRWAAPLAPSPVAKKNKSTLQANALPKQCPQNVANFTESQDDEDCLFLNVYSPPNARNLPVLVWIHGGGWDHNSATEFDPTPMINLSGNKFVAVIIQYRLGMFGFLAGSKDITSGLNAGIKDARFSLQWVQSYISLFGGNKNHVTLWGQSSGGGTILELVAQESRQPRVFGQGPLFHASVLSSPWTPPLGGCMDDFFVAQFQNISAAAGCPNDLQCLRQVNSTTLKSLNHQFDVPIPATHHLNYYTACIEGEDVPGGYIKQHPIKAIKEGSVYGSAILTGSNAADGTGTTPSNLSTTDLWTNFLVSHWPLTSDDIAEIDTLYLISDFDSSHARGTILYQDAVFSCSATWLTQSFAQFKGRNNAWRYLFAIPPANHAQDNAYEFPIWYQHLAPVSPTFFASYTGEITSFIRFFNPNVDRPKLADTLPWPSITNNNGETKVFNITLATNVSSVSLQPLDGVLTGTNARCDFWAKIRTRDGW